MADLEPDAISGALSDMLQSEGWRLLRDQAIKEWGGEGYGRRMKEAIDQIPVGPDRAYEIARVAEQVDATSNAVHQFIAWPSEELKRRVTPKEEPRRRFPRLRG